AFIDLGEKAHAVAVFFRSDFLGNGFFGNTEYVNIKEVLDKAAFGLHITNGPAHVYDLFGSLTQKKGMDKLIGFLQLLNEISRIPPNRGKVLNETQSAMKLTNKDSARLEP